MFEDTYILLFKLRFIVVITATIVCLPLLSLLPPVPSTVGSATSSTTSEYTYAYDGPNVVNSGMTAMLDSFGKAANSAGAEPTVIVKKGAYAVYGASRSVGIFTVHGAKVVASTAARGILFVGKAAGAGITYAAHGVIDGMLFAARGGANLIGSFTKIQTVNAFIRPADGYPVQVIEPATAVVSAEPVALPEAHTISDAPVSQASHHSQNDIAWPAKGRITTRYGVPHWPYQPVHTGIDISTGRASGVTPIMPFKAGRVVETHYTKQGLGNHVIIDHGEGLSSVYAHLASITVKVGQEANTATILGYEGSTGTSTGTHLHFEIRLHGRSVNPQQYLSGHP